MNSLILDHLTDLDPADQERYARIVLAHLTIPGERTPALARLDGHNALAIARHIIDTYPRPIPDADIFESLGHLRHGTHRVLIPTDSEWPTGLRDLGADQPVALWAKGNLDLISTPDQGVTITGARAATSYGETVAREFADYLTDTGHAVITGGSYGIDAAATRAVGDRAVVVLASGIERAYPAGNITLLQHVVRNGLLLSEAPPHVAPTRTRFIARARILAALTRATIITEAGTRSGAATVAHTAHRLGRTVGAVPGPITSASSSGCHVLIRQGVAELVTHPSEVITDPDQ